MLDCIESYQYASKRSSVRLSGRSNKLTRNKRFNDPQIFKFKKNYMPKNLCNASRDSERSSNVASVPSVLVKIGENSYSYCLPLYEASIYISVLNTI